VVWQPINIADYAALHEITIRCGESLLLTGGSGQTNADLAITITDASGTDYRSPITDHFPAPVLFDRAGVFTATAKLNGISAGTLVVTVVQADLQGPIACQIGYRREKSVIVNGTTSGIVFTPNDSTLVTVSVKTQTVQGVRLYIKSLKAGSPVVQARLGGSTGQVVTQQEVDEFTLGSQATMYIGVVETFPDGAKLLQTNLEMFPKVENLIVTLNIFIVGNTFEDSTLVKTINTSDFTLDPASGKYLYPYRMIRSPGAQGGGSPCHTIKITQGSDQVGQ